MHAVPKAYYVGLRSKLQSRSEKENGSIARHTRRSEDISESVEKVKDMNHSETLKESPSEKFIGMSLKSHHA